MTASSCFEVLICFDIFWRLEGLHTFILWRSNDVRWRGSFFMSFERCTSRSPCGGMVSGAVLPDVC